MTDRLLTRCTWLVIMTLIAGSAIASLMLLYTGLSRLIGLQFTAGLGLLGGGMLSGVGCYILCKNSDDLIDR